MSTIITAGVRHLVQRRVPAASRLVSFEAAVHEERDERVRPDGDRSVLYHFGRAADEGQLRERSSQRLVHLRPRPARVSYLQTLQTFTGSVSLQSALSFSLSRNVGLKYGCTGAVNLKSNQIKFICHKFSTQYNNS